MVRSTPVQTPVRQKKSKCVDVHLDFLNHLQIILNSVCTNGIYFRLHGIYPIGANILCRTKAQNGHEYEALKR